MKNPDLLPDYDCSECFCRFVPRAHSLFLIDQRVPVLCDSCRVNRSEIFVSMLIERFDAATGNDADVSNSPANAKNTGWIKRLFTGLKL